MSTDFKAMLQGARLPERLVSVCMRGDLVADHEAAERELKQAQRAAGNSMEGAGVAEHIERIEALESEMAEYTYQFRIRALPKPKFRAMVAAHPPRRDDDGDPVREDAAMGFDREAFFPALIRACTVDPVLDEAEWAELFNERLTDRQFGDLEDAAWFLNRGEVDVPFSLAASRAKRATASE